MVTFQLDRVQTRNYFAIRIFLIVHLFIAIGVTLLIDGPGDGITRVSGLLLGTFCAAIAVAVYHLYQAIVHHSIYGHYVLTKNTLVIKRPGHPRQFLRRADCTGFIPFRWDFTARSKKPTSLRGPGASAHFLRNVGGAIVKTWWPDFHASLTWAQIAPGTTRPILDCAVDFGTRGDRSTPTLRFQPQRSTLWAAVFYPYVLFLPIYVVCANLQACFVTVMEMNTYAQPWLALVVATTTGIAIITISLIWGRLWGQCLYERLWGQRFVLSERSLRILSPGRGWRTVRPTHVASYAPYSGRLFLSNGTSHPLATPSKLGSPLPRLLITAMEYWHNGSATRLEKRLPVESRGGRAEGSLIIFTILVLNGDELTSGDIFHMLFYTVVLVLLVSGMFFLDAKLGQERVSLSALEDQIEPTHQPQGATHMTS